MNPRFFLILLASIAVISVHAVGFLNLPTQRDYNFQPGGHIEIPLHVINADRIKVSISSLDEVHPETLGTPLDDNLMSYATLIDPAPGTGERSVTLKIDLPGQMKPGTYSVDVYAAEFPPDNPAMITAVAMTRTRFMIHVLTTEKSIEVTSLNLQPIAQGLKANATMVVTSRTLQNISRVQGTVTVFKDGVAIASAKTAAVPLLSGDAVTLDTMVPTEELEGGQYTANATVAYDGKEAYSNQAELKIGTLHVSVPDHTVNLTYNATNRFLFNVSNEWNKELQDVYVVVNANGQTKKTASQNIPPFGKTQYEVYFDRDETLMPGIASVNATVTFKDYDTRTKAYQDKQESFALPVTVVLPPQPKGVDAKAIAIYSIIGVLALLLIVAIVLLLRRPRAPAQAPAQPVQPPKQ